MYNYVQHCQGKYMQHCKASRGGKAMQLYNVDNFFLLSVSVA